MLFKVDPDPDPGKEIEVDPDPRRGSKWIRIRIRIRPNVVDPGGSGGSETLPFIFINLSKSILSHQISLDVFVSLMPELIVFVSLMCMSLWGKISTKHSGGRILSLRLISIDKS